MRGRKPGARWPAPGPRGPGALPLHSGSARAKIPQLPAPGPFSPQQPREGAHTRTWFRKHGLAAQEAGCIQMPGVQRALPTAAHVGEKCAPAL